MPAETVWGEPKPPDPEPSQTVCECKIEPEPTTPLTVDLVPEESEIVEATPTRTGCAELDYCREGEHSDGNEDEGKDDSDASTVSKFSAWLSAGLGLVFWLFL